MNKAKLVELAEEVLTDIDINIKSFVRKETEKKLLSRLFTVFQNAYHHLEDTRDIKYEPYKQAYKKVKPILDDSIDKLLNK
tara:strand:- start:46 stop:288 length:243 start_codon:yes stop_codon:yes gene_type:complete